MQYKQHGVHRGQDSFSFLKFLENFSHTFAPVLSHPFCLVRVTLRPVPSLPIPRSNDALLSLSRVTPVPYFNDKCA